VEGHRLRVLSTKAGSKQLKATQSNSKQRERERAKRKKRRERERKKRARLRQLRQRAESRGDPDGTLSLASQSPFRVDGENHPGVE
jgi:hypothetical protein